MNVFHDVSERKYFVSSFYLKHGTFIKAITIHLHEILFQIIYCLILINVHVNRDDFMNFEFITAYFHT